MLASVSMEIESGEILAGLLVISASFLAGSVIMTVALGRIREEIQKLRMKFDE